ncbi:hypothetical protein IF129_03695 [Streptomyces chumphonensis]|uniref:PknH-like extracellular domain-containing protein n=1 Tax=Streptomyces chumphonensis TaxID=1214925 RepID=A0A927EX89_9ACTN|nr:hypothetical protein [Streptomyces chumphonensis]MBD3930672.1 hypothetical protein [Streptomyces chumphonensis]
MRAMEAHQRPGLARAALVLVLLAGPVVLTGGCAGSTGTSGRPAGPTLQAGRLTEEGLRLAVLSLADLPAGWAADTSAAARERGIGVPEPGEGPCRVLFRGPSGGGEARFARTEVGPFLVARTGSHADVDAARGALASFRAAAGQCPGFQLTEGPRAAGHRVDYHAERAEAPELGDESVAVRYVRPGTGDRPVTVVADVVHVRVGAHTVHLAQSGREDPGGGSIVPFARLALEKLRAVAAGGTPSPAGSFPGATRL